MKQQWKEHMKRMDLKVKRSHLFTEGFGILPPRTSEEEEHIDAESNAAVIEVIDAGVAAYHPPDDEESKGGTKAPDAIREKFSRTYFEKKVGKKNNTL